MNDRFGMAEWSAAIEVFCVVETMSNTWMEVAILVVYIRRPHRMKSRSGADRGRDAPYTILHHLVLGHASTICLHSIPSICVCVLDVGEAERPSPVLIPGEFSCKH
jgi:hypothetical protein